MIQVTNNNEVLRLEAEHEQDVRDARNLEDAILNMCDNDIQQTLRHLACLVDKDGVEKRISSMLTLYDNDLRHAIHHLALMVTKMRRKENGTLAHGN